MKFIIEVWETRSHRVPVEAATEDEAKEIALEHYDELSTEDSFISVEFREIEKASSELS